MRDLLLESDLVVANLETPLSPDGADLTHEKWRFNSPRAYAEALQWAGVGFVTTANNHCLDRGTAGVAATVRVLDELERFQIICSRTIHVTRRAGLRGIASEISHAKSAKFAKFGRASGISLAENAEFTFGERHKSRLRRKTVFDGSRHGHAGS